MKFKMDFEPYNQMIKDLKGNMDKIVTDGVYKGGGAAADAVRSGVSGISAISNKGWAVVNKRGVKEWEKNALLKGIGTSKIETDGADFTNTRVGFAGYYNGSDVPYRHKSGKGVPIPMLARSIEKGTSFMVGTRVIAKALRSNKNVIIKVMADTIEKNIEKITK